MDVPHRIGVLGGSFNPPHIAHLAVASDACTALDLERVLFVPAWSPPHKEIDDDVTAAERLAMTELAIAGDERFVASPVEIELGLRYTVDTLTEIGRRHPGRGLVFIIGSDTLLQLDTWHEPRRVLALAEVAVALRPGDKPGEMQAVVQRWGSDRLSVIDAAAIDVSSTMVRERVRAGRPIRYLVPRAVEDYIREHALYKGS